MKARWIGIMLVGLLVASGHAAKPEFHDLEKAVMGCTWSFRNPAVKGGIQNMRFWTDSAVTSAVDAVTIIGIWHVTGADEVTVLYGPASSIKLTFGEKRGGFRGEDGLNKSIDGEHLETLLPKGAVKKMQPVAASISSRPGQSQIDIISEQAPTITSGVIVPLDATALDHRAAITALRDNLADEALAHPAASPEIYQTATRLCNAWLISLDERDKRVASYGQTRPTSAFGISRQGNLRPGDYYRYLREVSDAHRKELEDWRLAQFFNDAEKKRWMERSLVLRQGLDALESQIHEGLKQRASAK